MNIMSVDCEFNQPSQNLIQIGAVIFKSKDCTIMDELLIYVDPKEPLNPDIITLTGITDDQVVGALSPLEAYNRLKEFHHKHRCVRNPICWGSGVRNDSQAIHEQSGVQEPNFMGYRVIDAKTIYQSYQMAANGKFKGGLGTAMEALGLTFEGRAHDALVDARNTARIWHYMVQALKTLQK